MYSVTLVVLFSEIAGRIYEFRARVKKRTFRALRFTKRFQTAIQGPDAHVLACEIANVLINR
jgi:ribulose 1,5-bisphosphate carboxylase large subunit-like protein